MRKPSTVLSLGHKNAKGEFVADFILCTCYPVLTKEQIADLSFHVSDWAKAFQYSRDTGGNPPATMMPFPKGVNPFVQPKSEDTVLALVSKAFDVSVEEILSRKRTERLCRPRCASAWIYRSVDGWTFEEIARKLNRCESDIRCCIKRIEQEQKLPHSALWTKIRFLVQDYISKLYP